MLQTAAITGKLYKQNIYASSSEVVKPTFNKRKCLQRALIGKHSNWIVRPLEAVLKETNNYFEDSEPFYVCVLASTERDAISLFLVCCQAQVQVRKVRN